MVGRSLVDLSNSCSKVASVGGGNSQTVSNVMSPITKEIEHGQAVSVPCEHRTQERSFEDQDNCSLRDGVAQTMGFPRLQLSKAFLIG